MFNNQSLSSIMTRTDYRLAVLVPCRNEGLTIAQVVKRFQATLPEAEIHVYDNRSTDRKSVV